jgi:hypothetical protein
MRYLCDAVCFCRSPGGREQVLKNTCSQAMKKQDVAGNPVQ